MQPIGSEQRPLRIAIIGSGPASFYAAADLFKQESLVVEIDMFDRLPTPYGLVRGGVAPDHQKIKNVIKIYERTAQHPRFRFFGNVTLGEDIQREELLKHFDCIIYGVGAQSDRQMGIPGEDLTGSFSATEFVGWYNGHPDFMDRKFDLSVEKVAVIGMGNVAVDVARILSKTTEELAQTDIADDALQALKESQVKEIYMIARRGPVQAAFTPPEARELLELEQTVTLVDPQALELDSASQQELETTKQKDTVRNFELIKKMAENHEDEKSRKLRVLFLYSPVEVQGEAGRVSGIKLVKNQLVEAKGRVKAVATEEFEELSVGLVFRSIGYQGVAIAGVPYDDWSGTIPNEEGRVMDPATKTVMPQDYVVGWAKRGPSGVIGTNKPDAIETTKNLIKDYQGQQVEDSDAFKAKAVEDWLKAKNIDYVTFEGWKVLDQIEVEAGAKKGKPREKITHIDEMLRRIK